MYPWFLACHKFRVLLRCVDLAILWESIVDVHAELAFWLFDSASTIPQIICLPLVADTAFREPHAVVVVALYGSYALRPPARYKSTWYVDDTKSASTSIRAIRRGATGFMKWMVRSMASSRRPRFPLRASTEDGMQAWGDDQTVACGPTLAS